MTIAVSAQPHAVLAVRETPTGELVVAVQSGFHSDYGCTYPLTYQLDIPQGVSALTIRKKFSTADSWKDISEKTSNDFFNGIEAIRFDYLHNRAYVSVAFSPDADSLFLAVSDKNGNTVVPRYAGIARYYDNRRAAVTATADDWSDWVVLDHRFSTLTSLLRSYNLCLTIGVISDGNNCSPTSWKYLQQQLDSGSVEVAAHSRTHPNTPYADAVGEIAGCYSDITTNLTLPLLFRKNSKEYVYVWIAPYGDYDAVTDSLLSVWKYLVPRLYTTGTTTFSAWDEHSGHFAFTNPTVELGKPSWGGGDSDRISLNAKFDSVAQAGGVYHFMWHPQVLFDDRNKSYLANHFSYISNRKDILYADLGHLYLYRLLEQANNSVPAGAALANNVRYNFELNQNYPNPFNPSTTISYTLSKPEPVTMEVFNVAGQHVRTILRDTYQSAGQHHVAVEMGECSTGVYFYKLTAGYQLRMKSMVLLK
jgi:hypothetical protein